MVVRLASASIRTFTNEHGIILFFTAYIYIRASYVRLLKDIVYEEG